MIKLSNFLFYLGLFTINAFRYNWLKIFIITTIVGIIPVLIFKSPWQFIPSFIGAYLAELHNEYVQFKNESNEH